MKAKTFLMNYIVYSLVFVFEISIAAFFPMLLLRTTSSATIFSEI